MKYIIYDNAGYIFPLFVTHLEFAQNNNFKQRDIQGAGFLSLGCKNNSCFVSCYGESISLDKVSRSEDADIIHQTIFL